MLNNRMKISISKKLISKIKLVRFLKIKKNQEHTLKITIKIKKKIRKINKFYLCLTNNLFSLRSKITIKPKRNYFREIKLALYKVIIKI